MKINLPKLPEGWEYGFKHHPLTEDNRECWELSAHLVDSDLRICQNIYKYDSYDQIDEDSIMIAANRLVELSNTYAKYGELLGEEEILELELKDAIDFHNIGPERAETRKKLVTSMTQGSSVLEELLGVKDVIISDQDDIRPSTKDFPIG